MVRPPLLDTFAARTCNANDACVSQADADTVHDLGSLEYKWVFHCLVFDWSALTLSTRSHVGDVVENMAEHVRLSFGTFITGPSDAMLTGCSRRYTLRVSAEHKVILR